MGKGKFIISQENWDKVMAFAHMSYDELKSEIGGMLVAFLDKESKIMVLKDPVIGKQEVSSGNCTLDKEWLADYYCKMAMKYGTDVKFVWWHSHHTMGAFWSGTDLEAIKEFSNSKYSMSLVVNLKQEYKFRVNWWEPTHGHLDYELTIIKPDLLVTDQMKEDFKELVSKEAPMPRPVYNDRYGSYRDHYMTAYKQPGSHGPGAVDAELMDTQSSVQDKLCDVADRLIDDAFTNDIKWKTFSSRWSKLMEDGKAHNIIIYDFPKKDFNTLKEGHFVNATDYFKDTIGTLSLTRGNEGYDDPLQQNMFGI